MIWINTNTQSLYGEKNKMKIYYYDFGLWKGTEINWMVREVFPALNVSNYKIFGFEACKKYSDLLTMRYQDNDKVTIINKAVVDTPRKVKLYHAPNHVGHSVFSTKRNVSKNYEEVDGIVFSDWLKENVRDYKMSLNIIKVNIEGSEWYLFNDLVSSGVHNHIDIYCGQGHDVEKVGELQDKVERYYELLKENNINLYRFTEYLPQKNDDIVEIIKQKIKEY
jgi:FkbM family methyltransferase